MLKKAIQGPIHVIEVVRLNARKLLISENGGVEIFFVILSDRVPNVSQAALRSYTLQKVGRLMEERQMKTFAVDH